MNKFKWILLALVTVFIVYPHIHIGGVINHDEDLAAQAAKKFAETVFIKQDFTAGYSLLSDQAKREILPEKFKQVLVNMNQTGYPLIVVAIAFEPIPGAKAMNIYLKGENGGEKFYYKFYMQGTKEDGYKTAGFFKITEKGSASNLMRFFNPPI